MGQFDHFGDRVNVRDRFSYLLLEGTGVRIAIEESKWRGLPLPVDSSIKPKGNHPPNSIREHSSMAKLASQKVSYVNTVFMREFRNSIIRHYYWMFLSPLGWICDAKWFFQYFKTWKISPKAMVSKPWSSA